MFYCSSINNLHKNSTFSPARLIPGSPLGPGGPIGPWAPYMFYVVVLAWRWRQKERNEYTEFIQFLDPVWYILSQTLSSISSYEFSLYTKIWNLFSLSSHPNGSYGTRRPMAPRIPLCGAQKKLQIFYTTLKEHLIIIIVLYLYTLQGKTWWSTCSSRTVISLIPLRYKAV